MRESYLAACAVARDIILDRVVVGRTGHDGRQACVPALLAIRLVHGRLLSQRAPEVARA